MYVFKKIKFILLKNCKHYQKILLNQISFIIEKNDNSCTKSLKKTPMKLPAANVECIEKPQINKM